MRFLVEMYAIRDLLELDNDGPQGLNVAVALVDSGVDFSHPDLCTACLPENSQSFLICRELFDEDGHGSHLAGIIAGSGAVEASFTGVAPKCVVHSLRVHRKGQSFDADNAAAAVLEAIRLKADIINLSSGLVADGKPPWIWSDRLTDLEKAIERAIDAGILCVVAAGNSGPAAGSISVPAGLPRVLSVGSVEWDSRLSQHSSRGPFRRSAVLSRRSERYCAVSGPTIHQRRTEFAKPDLVCFGEQIASARASSSELGEPGEQYIPLGGTSQATAAVTGLATRALSHLRSAGADLGDNAGTTLRSLLISSTILPPRVDRMEYGFGVLSWPKLKDNISLYLSDENYASTIRRMVPLQVLG
ncbi:MAG: S8 family serine peptidase [Gemmatimonadaceae bacterium]|nr:S8 family serine peptidase [Gemmatimonadaceae bacterium]